MGPLTSSDILVANEQKEKSRVEANAKCYEFIYKNFCHLRDNWYKEMELCHWNVDVNEVDEEELELLKDVCAFIIKTQELLVTMIIDHQIDFATGYTSIEDAIADVNSPDSISFAMMEREHRKFLPPDFYLEFTERISSGNIKRVIKRHNNFPRIYYQKNGEDIFNYAIYKIFKDRLGLQNLEYRMGLGLEQVLGGKCVLINCEESLFSEKPVNIAIKEGIGYDFETKKFFIKSETQILDFVGRLHINEIPTMTTDNKLWLKYYRP